MLFVGSIGKLCECGGHSPKIMIFDSFLVLVGLALFFYGTPMSNQVMNPESLISGRYLVVLGVFLRIAGFLMLMLQMFQHQSLSYLGLNVTVRLGKLPKL